MTPKRHLLFGIPPGQWFAVFAIIVLMYAILFLVFYPSGESIRRASCLSNLKQLGLAYVQYEQDSDSYLPSGVNTAGSGWAGQLYPYTKSVGVYRCADDAHASPFISYAENRNLVRQNVRTLSKPSAIVALYEFSTLNCDPSLPETVSTTGLSAPQNSTRHDSQSFGLDSLYADGHVKYLMPWQVSGGTSAVPPTQKAGYLATFAVK